MSEKKPNLLFKLIKFVSKPLRGKDLNRFSFVRGALNLTLRYLKPKYVLVEGNKLFLDKEDSLRLSIVGTYEPTMVKVFKEKVMSGGTVLDIGGHIGYYTLLAAKGVGKNGKVYVFEPDIANRLLLNKNIETNGCKNIIVVDKAVSEKTKEMTFFLSSDNDAHHSLVENGGKKEVRVQAVSIDDFFKNRIPQVSVIKMDIEGGEFGAVKGMKNLIENNKKLSLFIEFSPQALKRAGNSPESLLDLLEKLNFTLYVIDENRGKVEKLNRKELFASHSESRDWHVNLLAIKG